MQSAPNQAVVSTEVVNILRACGLDRPDTGVLSEEFLAEIRGLEQKNLARGAEGAPESRDRGSDAH